MSELYIKGKGVYKSDTHEKIILETGDSELIEMLRKYEKARVKGLEIDDITVEASVNLRFKCLCGHRLSFDIKTRDIEIFANGCVEGDIESEMCGENCECHFCGAEYRTRYDKDGNVKIYLQVD